MLGFHKVLDCLLGSPQKTLEPSFVSDVYFMLLTIVFSCIGMRCNEIWDILQSIQRLFFQGPTYSIKPSNTL